MVQILLIDDDRELTAMLAEYLEGDGFQVTVSHNGADGLERARTGRFDVVLLDIMLPGRDGFEVLRALRRERATPVLMLTARGSDVDTVVGLELGADDYLSKPCNPRVLVARLRALLRRGQPMDAVPPVLRVGDLTLDPGRRTVHRGEGAVELTSTEFDLLACLLRHAGHVVDKDSLSREALGRALTPFDRSIDMHISNLRRKLGAHPDGGPRIKTVRGSGYQYVVGARCA